MKTYYTLFIRPFLVTLAIVALVVIGYFILKPTPEEAYTKGILLEKYQGVEYYQNTLQEYVSNHRIFKALILTPQNDTVLMYISERSYYTHSIGDTISY